MKAMDEVVVEYQLTWGEFRRMQWGVGRRRNIILVIAVLILASITALAGDDLQWRIAAGMPAVGVPLLLFWIFPRNEWNNGLGIQGPRRVTVGDEGLVVKSESVEFKLKWKQIVRVEETNDYFVLFSKKRIALFVILKRGLRSKDDEGKLRLLLEDRVRTTS